MNPLLKKYWHVIVIAILLLLWFQSCQNQKATTNENDIAWKQQNNRLKKDIESLNDSLLQNKIERKLLNNQIATIRQERDDLKLVKRNIIKIHDEKVNIINNASNSDIIKLFTGFERN